MKKEMKKKYVCILCAETRPEKFKEEIRHLCKKCLKKIVKEAGY